MAQSRKVLIIEDEQIFAENLQTHFQRCGWDARVACNGKLAVIAADEFLPELILLDFHLPDMTGFQVLDAIRESHDCPGCVLMTGHPIETVLADAQRRGIDHILCKPFSLARLQSVMLASATDANDHPLPPAQ
jgi:DNA-binding response OmpR family regulator